ncbi:MAG: protein GlxC [Gammaproteobacteria bacterium]|nr:protein GlxC [Gammaproteobacteria bacterium]
MRTVDLKVATVRELNQALHELAEDGAETDWKILNAAGNHALAVGINARCRVEIMGHVGYYCAGMNKYATLTINGNAATGLAENMMSGLVRLRGDASQSAGATGRGGLLVIEGNAAARCGISLKGLDIVVKGSVGHMSAFMAQRGRMVICGDAGSALGDSLYETQLFVKGKVVDLGADCIEKEMRAEHVEAVEALLAKAGINERAQAFRRYGSARKLYHFNIDHADAY